MTDTKNPEVIAIERPRPGRKRRYSAAEKQPDNGPPYTALATRAFGADLGLSVCTTPAYSPESNGVAEAFVKTFKRDYVYLNRLATAGSVIARLATWFEDYNEHRPHSGLRMKSPSQYRRQHQTA